MTLRADRIRTLREQRGWSQRELAHLCGLGDTQIFKYENGHSDPSSTNLGLIADQLGVSVDFLLDRTDDPRGHFDDGNLNADEHDVLAIYRRDGWPGVAHLSIERLAK